MMTTTHLPPKEIKKTATAAEAADCVREAYESGSPVHMALEKMNRLIDYPAEDMTVTVEAGMTVAELQRILAEKHQWLPVDVPSPERTTIGEAIDANASGPRRFGHGSLRDYLLGFTAIDGLGTTFSGGGRVVKDAAGYNMCRLLAGSRGALAIVTQATLMTRPRPETTGFLAVEVRNFDAAERFLAALTASPAQPISLELEAGSFTDEADENPLCGAIDGKNAARLCLGFDGTPAEVAWMIERTLKDWKSLGMTQPTIMPRLADDRYWRWATEFAADQTLFVLPSEVVHTVEKLRRESPTGVVHASDGDGVIRMKGIGDWGLEISDASDGNMRFQIARAIKERFDPKNILPPLPAIDEC